MISMESWPPAGHPDWRVDPLAFLTWDPRCAESQADGVPCEDLGRACAECPRLRAHWQHMLAYQGPV